LLNNICTAPSTGELAAGEEEGEREVEAEEEGAKVSTS
jgi:hypothetical protein